AAVSRSEPRPHDAIPAFAVEAGDGGRARLPAALGTLPRLNRRPSARACAREAGGGGASQFAAPMTAARLAREPGTHTPRCAPRDAYGSALYARAVSARNQARLWPSSIQVSRRLAVATSPASPHRSCALRMLRTSALLSSSSSLSMSCGVTYS